MKTENHNYVKSPFFIDEEFLSPLLCEQIVDNLSTEFNTPDYDENNIPSLVKCTNEPSQNIIINKFENDILSKLEHHFNVSIDKVTQPNFLWYPERYTNKQVFCDNSNYISNKWHKTKKRDLSITIFLSTFCKDPSIDCDYEVYGGKIDYPQYNFGFEAQRGSLIIHPSDPHFLYSINDIIVGDLLVCKFYLTTKDVYVYNPQHFPGNYKTWF